MVYEIPWTICWHNHFADRPRRLSTRTNKTDTKKTHCICILQRRRVLRLNTQRWRHTAVSTVYTWVVVVWRKSVTSCHQYVNDQHEWQAQRPLWLGDRQLIEEATPKTRLMKQLQHWLRDVTVQVWFLTADSCDAIATASIVRFLNRRLVSKQ